MNRSAIRTMLGLLAVLVLAVFVAACGDDDEKDSSGGSATTTQPSSTGDISAEEKTANKIKPVDGASSTSLTVGSKNFPEQFILAEIYAQALDAAGYKVKKDLDLGSELIAYKALRDGNVDAYPEYTGTSLINFFKVKFAEVPRDPQQAYEDAKAAYAKDNITALPPTAFENSYRLGVTKATAEKLGNPTKISDIADEAKNLTVTGYPECRQREDCLLSMQTGYGVKFKKFLPGQNTYQLLDNGDADIAFVFTTDGPLTSGKYVMLDDDKKIYPPYNITFTVRNELAEKLGPEGQKVVADVQKYMTNDIVQELNARFTSDKKQPDEIAEEYLEQFGFIS